MMRDTGTLHRSTMRLIAALVLAMVLVACGTPPTPLTPPVTADAIDGVTISPSTTTIGVGGTATLTADVSVVSGSPSQSVIWTSADDEIATVVDGTVTGIDIGTVVITATSVFDDAFFGTAMVSVVDADTATMFVDASADEGGNGSQALPFRTIQDGIDAVTSGGTVNVAAGTYEESLYIDKPFVLEGAGAGLVTIASSANAGGEFSLGSIDIDGVDGVDGLVLRGFTLDVLAPGPSTAGITMYRFPRDVLLEDLVVNHDSGNADLHAINIVTATNVTVRNVRLTEASGVGDGAGIRVVGASTGIVIEDVTTTGHERGVSLDPMAQVMSNISVAGTFTEVNKMSLLLNLGGSVTDLNAPQFTHAVRDFGPVYRETDWWFYKESEGTAILDSLFNFSAGGTDGTNSFVQRINVDDQGELDNWFVVGSADGAPYGEAGVVRSHNVQNAITEAAPGATIIVRPGTFVGPFDIDTAEVSLTGEGTEPASDRVFTSDVGAVLTISAADVSISGVAVTGDAVGVLVDNVTGFSITQSNLLTDPSLENVGGNPVQATPVYWGAADGPSGAGGGGELIDPDADVVFVPFATSPY